MFGKTRQLKDTDEIKSLQKQLQGQSELMDDIIGVTHDLQNRIEKLEAAMRDNICNGTDLMEAMEHLNLQFNQMDPKIAAVNDKFTRRIQELEKDQHRHSDMPTRQGGRGPYMYPMETD